MSDDDIYTRDTLPGPTCEAETTCEHDRIERVHQSGSGHYAIYVWICPDCDFRETDGWEP